MMKDCYTRTKDEIKDIPLDKRSNARIAIASGWMELTFVKPFHLQGSARIFCTKPNQF